MYSDREGTKTGPPTTNGGCNGGSQTMKTNNRSNRNRPSSTSDVKTSSGNNQTSLAAPINCRPGRGRGRGRRPLSLAYHCNASNQVIASNQNQQCLGNTLVDRSDSEISRDRNFVAGDRRQAIGNGKSKNTSNRVPASTEARPTVHGATASIRETQDQTDELMALTSIYDQPGVFSSVQGGCEGRFCAHVDIPQPFFIMSRKIKKSPPAGGRLESMAAECLESNIELIPVMFLPPITLFFNLPYDYPSTRQPRYRLSCNWLSKDQISTLCRRLDDIWNDGRGEVVLFKWTVFLKEDSLAVLDIHDKLDLLWISDAFQQVSKEDSRSKQEMGMDRLATVLPSILEFDKNRREQVFKSEFFNCNVCLEKRVGAKCMRFQGCEHIYCIECMKSYFEIQIVDGNVNQLRCPSDKCSSQALPSQVRELVGSELFAKYDRLLLTSTLDSMTDIAYCPRDSCQCAVLLEPGSTLASCPSCRFAFCTFCMMAYHGIEPCKFKSDERLLLYNKYTSGNADEKIQLEKRYGRNQLKRLVEATMSDTWLKENSKCCPRCKAQIEKDDGCNKMTCWKCNTCFCWLCMQRLDPTDPYRHYDRPGNGSCNGRLFEGTIGDFDDNDDLFDFGDEDLLFDGFESDVSTDYED